MQQGDRLPTIQKQITQAQIERYAAAAGDFNPIHLDAEFARGVQFGGASLDGTIAHGMMILAAVSEMLTLAFGEAWLNSGKLKVRFRGPVYPRQTITTYGEIKTVTENEGIRQVACSVGVRSNSGAPVIVGDAVISAVSDH